MVSVQDDLGTRYGTPAPWRRRALLAGVGVVVAAFAAWLGWATIYHSEPEVQSQLVSFDVVDARTVTATVDVEVEDGVTGLCRLRAFAEDHSVVGEIAFEVVPAEGQRYAQQLRTDRLATSVESLGCTTTTQPRPR